MSGTAVASWQLWKPSGSCWLSRWILIDPASPRSSVWLPRSLASDGPFPSLLFAGLERVFPLDALSWLHGTLVSRLLKAARARSRWHGFRLLAADKTTLALPESRPLFERFGAHKGSQGLGPVAVEFCCLFDLIARAPLRFIHAKVCSSEHKLILKLIEHLKKGDLLLLDSGFYYCATFAKILLRRALYHSHQNDFPASRCAQTRRR